MMVWEEVNATTLSYNVRFDQNMNPENNFQANSKPNICTMNCSRLTMITMLNGWHLFFFLHHSKQVSSMTESSWRSDLSSLFWAFWKLFFATKKNPLQNTLSFRSNKLNARWFWLHSLHARMFARLSDCINCLIINMSIALYW